MSNLVKLLRCPQCLHYVRRIATDDISEAALPFHRQLRGKKKFVAKQPATVNVKLLEDIRGYGRQGSIIPVAPGRMRNIWYPQQKAEYMTEPRLRELNRQDLVIERDYAFGMEQPKDESAPEEAAEQKLVDVEMKLLPPQEATEIMSASIPDHLIFYRTPIVNPEPEAPQHEPPIPDSKRYASSASAAAADLSAAADSLSATSNTLSKAQPVTIYGSVSTADIAESIKAVLAVTENGARIVLTAEDIMLVRGDGAELGVEADRLKALGDFEVDVRVKGGDAVRRTVSVKAQEG